MRLTLLLATCLAGPPSLAAQAAPAPSARPARTLVKAGRLIDGRATSPQAGVGILIDGDRITAVGPIARVESQAAGARVIDLSGMTVLPGFIDTHTHLLLQGDPTGGVVRRAAAEAVHALPRDPGRAQCATRAGARVHDDPRRRDRGGDVRRRGRQARRGAR